MDFTLKNIQDLLNAHPTDCVVAVKKNTPNKVFYYFNFTLPDSVQFSEEADIEKMDRYDGGMPSSRQLIAGIGEGRAWFHSKTETRYLAKYTTIAVAPRKMMPRNIVLAVEILGTLFSSGSDRLVAIASKGETTEYIYIDAGRVIIEVPGKTRSNISLVMFCRYFFDKVEFIPYEEKPEFKNAWETLLSKLSRGVWWGLYRVRVQKISTKPVMYFKLSDCPSDEVFKVTAVAKTPDSDHHFVTKSISTDGLPPPCKFGHPISLFADTLVLDGWIFREVPEDEANAGQCRLSEIKSKLAAGGVAIVTFGFYHEPGEQTHTFDLDEDGNLRNLSAEADFENNELERPWNAYYSVWEKPSGLINVSKVIYSNTIESRNPAEILLRFREMIGNNARAAEHLGISGSHLSRLVNGKHPVSPKLIARATLYLQKKGV